MVKKDTTDTATVPTPQVKTGVTSSIPIIALVLGVTSLVGFMWFLGIPAIILGIIGLRRYQENRGLSIAGLVSGIISTLLLVCATLFFIVMIAVALVDSDSSPESTYPHSYDTPYERDYGYPERGSREGI